MLFVLYIMRHLLAWAGRLELGMVLRITTAFLRKPFTLQLKINFLDNLRIGTMPSGEFSSGDGLPIRAASTISSATPSSLRTIFKKYNMHIPLRLFAPKVDPSRKRNFLK